MPKSALHVEVEQIAANKGAMLLSAELLKAVALDSLQRSLAFGGQTKVEFPTGHDDVIGHFKSASVASADLRADLLTDQGKLYLAVSPVFTVVLELAYRQDPALIFSTVRLDLRDVRLPVDGSGEEIRFLPPVVPVSATVSASANRNAAIAAAGISTDELLRVEGSIAYAAGPRLASSAIGQAPAINLKRLFPALSFAGDLELHEAQGGLLIVPEAFALIGNPGCPKGDAMGGVEILPQNAQRPSDDAAEWQHAIRLPQLAPRRFQIDGPLASVYMPKVLLDEHFGKTTPAIAYRDSDNGFIGWDLQLTCAIRGVTVSVVPDQGALLLDIDLATWGIVMANVDVPCVGRMDLAQAKFEMPKDDGTARIEAALRLAIDTGGRLMVTCEMTKIELGEARVDVQLFSKYLGMAGGEAAVYGFIIDGIIGRVLAHNLPGIIFDKIRDEVNRHFFVLADLAGLLKQLARSPNTPVFSGDDRSALMGCKYAG